ncbi:MAG: hypothetical protein ACOCZP_01305, partial [Candidatus Hadarchaeota archaeon]
MPEEEELAEDRKKAKRALNQTLGQLSTERSQELVSTFNAELDDSTSKSEINSVLNQISAAYEAEQKRKALIENAKQISVGTFDNIPEFRSTMTNEIQDADSLSELENLEEEMPERATEAWREHHESDIGGINTEEVVRIKKNSLISEARMEKSLAQEFLSRENWEVLSKATFREFNTFLVPVTNSFKQSPGAELDGRVDVVHYIEENDKTIRRVQNTEIKRVLYPSNVLATIDWNAEISGSSSYSESDEELYENALQILEMMREMDNENDLNWENESNFTFEFSDENEEGSSREESETRSFSTDVWEE